MNKDQFNWRRREISWIMLYWLKKSLAGGNTSHYI